MTDTRIVVGTEPDGPSVGLLSAFNRWTFAQAPEPVLLEVLHRGSPVVLLELADGWAALAASLQERAHDLGLEYRRLEPTWTGRPARQYGEQLAETIRAVRRVAQVAAEVATVLSSAASALRSAQQLHPAPAGVGEVPGRPHVGRPTAPPDIGDPASFLARSTTGV
ncbi:MAG: PPE domain-containing protein [Phycicoccus sp.]